MSWQAWATAAIVVGVIIFLVKTQRSPDVVFIGAITLLMVLRIVTPSEAFSGLSNEGVITIGVLYAVAAGLRDTGAVAWLGAFMLGKPRSVRRAQLRVMSLTGIFSAFMNNTPLVGIMIPAVEEWARKNRASVSRLLMPLSFASILGGACTLIGTSTNLIVSGWLSETMDGPGLGMFELSWVGIPVAVAGIAFMSLFSSRILRDRRPVIDVSDDTRKYTAETVVDPDGPLVGKLIEDAGLRRLPGLFLMEIERNGKILPAVAPNTELHANDRLVFVGVIESVVDLHKIRGLSPAPDQLFQIGKPRSRRILVESVISSSCPIVGLTIRDGKFRTKYGAVVIAVARKGRRISGRIGDIILETGDTLLLETTGDFVTAYRNSRDFLLIAPIEDYSPPTHQRAPAALVILGAMVATVATGILDMLSASLIAAGLMLLFKCTTAGSIRKSVDWKVLLTIAASLGIGQGIANSGLATAIAWPFVSAASISPTMLLLAFMVASMILSAVVGAKAAAVLILPIALVTTETLGISFRPVAMGIMFACSTSLTTPLSYPTNLMVYGIGGYRFSDYMKLGIPISIITITISLVLIPVVWPF